MFWQQCLNVLLGGKVRKMPYPRLWGILIAFRFFSMFCRCFFFGGYTFNLWSPTHKWHTFYMAWCLPVVTMEVHGNRVLISSTQQLPYGACRKTAAGRWTSMDAIESPTIVSLDSYVVTSLARFSAILWSYKLLQIYEIKTKRRRVKGASHNAKYLRVVGGESRELVSQVLVKEDSLKTTQKQTYRQGLDSMAHNNANSRRRWLSETELAATLTKMEVCLGHVHCMTDDDLISVSSRF